MLDTEQTFFVDGDLKVYIEKENYTNSRTTSNNICLSYLVQNVSICTTCNSNNSCLRLLLVENSISSRYKKNKRHFPRQYWAFQAVTRKHVF